MTYYVYKITNNSSGKIYIGKTNDLQKRWYNHVYCALVNKENTYFYNAIRKYGALKFVTEAIEECESEEQALGREKYWINFLKSNLRDIGYNLTDGGDGISGFKHTEETKRKIAAVHLGKKHSDEHNKKISEGNTGKVIPQNVREKISIANSGENNGMYGKTISSETRNKLSEFQSSRERTPLTEEHKQKNREATLKQDHSFRISIELKSKVISMYASGNYTKRQIADHLGLKYNSVVKILRTNKKASL